MNYMEDTDDTDGAFGCAFLLMLVFFFSTVILGCVTKEVSKSWEEGKIEAHQETEKTSNQ